MKPEPMIEETSVQTAQAQPSSGAARTGSTAGLEEAKKLHRAIRSLLDLSYKKGGAWPADAQAEIHKLTESYNSFADYLKQLNKKVSDAPDSAAPNRKSKL